MTATFKQDLINVRERLNQLENHRHDALYAPKGTFIGKNLLINSDKSESQRGDFTSASSATSGEYYVDRCRAVVGTVTADHIHNGFDSAAEGRTIQLTATSSGATFLIWQQRVEQFLLLQGKTVTYTALIKSNNSSALVSIATSAGTYFSSTHSGNGEFELLSVTVPLDKTLTYVYANAGINNADSDATITSSDYFQLGKEQLEIGNKFTGFEHVLPAINRINCEWYYRQFMIPALFVKYTNSLQSNVELFTSGYSAMRTSPIATILTSPVLTNVGSLVLNANRTHVSLTGTTGLTVGDYGIDASGVYELNSEL